MLLKVKTLTSCLKVQVARLVVLGMAVLVAIIGLIYLKGIDDIAPVNIAAVGIILSHLIADP